MGGDPMPHLNHSSPVVDPSIYGYGGQKRSLDEGGKAQKRESDKREKHWVIWEFWHIVASKM